MRFSNVGERAGTARVIRAPAPSINGNPDQPEHVAETIEEIVRLENRDRIRMGVSDRLSSWIAAFGGSMLYVWLHVAWFSTWIVLNVLFVFAAFDPYPFGLLTMIVSLEAIFLSTFVLISQNRQALAADRRAKVDLQLNMIAEREITKVMEMVAHVHEHLGLRAPSHDAELEEMQRPTHVGRLADAVDDAERQHDPEGARGPESAADTEKR